MFGVNKSVEPAKPSLTEKYSFVGHREVDGQKVQVGIGGIDVGDENVNVGVLPGCSKAGLLDTMQRVAQETGKPTKAVFNEQEILVQPEGQEG